MYNLRVFSTIKLLQVATVVLVHSSDHVLTHSIFSINCKHFLCRDKSGGRKADPRPVAPVAQRYLVVTL